MEKKKLEQETVQKIIGVVFLVLFLLQAAILCYFNLRDVRFSMDHDMANGFYHYQQVIKNGTLNIPNWRHTTSLELDTTFLFAWPLYYVLHDLFLASGISSILYIGIYCITIYGILRCAKVDRTFCFITLTLVLTPYTFGMLDYMNMLFFGVSWYTVKVLAPLMMVWLIQLFGKWNESSKKQRIGMIAILALYIVMLFTTTFSTGIYTFVGGIFPIMAYMAYDIWLEGSFKNKYNKMHLMLIVISLVTFLIGYKFYGLIYAESSRADMSLTKLENYAINIRACVAGIFQLFGGIPYEDIQVMSFDGMLYCLRFGLVILFLIAFIVNIPRIFSKEKEISAQKYLTVLFFFTVLILVISDTRYSTNTTMEYRYYLIGAVPLIVLFGIQFFQMHSKWNAFQKYFCLLGTIIILIFLMVGNNKFVYKNWDRSGYAFELSEYFKTLDVDSVFFINDPKTSNICRALDSSHEYGAFNSSDQKLEVSYCSYEASKHGDFYGNKNAVAIITGTAMTDYLPEEIASQYTLAGTVRWYDIYISDHVHFE